jgi:hypothetical protein
VNLLYWNDPIDCPKAVRSLAYAMVSVRICVAFAWQPLHHGDEAPVDLADEAVLGHPDIGEEQLTGVRLGLTDLVQLRPPLEPGPVVFDREQADPLRALPGAGAGRHEHQVGRHGIGDERLRAVDDPLGPVPHGARAERTEV